MNNFLAVCLLFVIGGFGLAVVAQLALLTIAVKELASALLKGGLK